MEYLESDIEDEINQVHFYKELLLVRVIQKKKKVIYPLNATKLVPGF